MVIEAPESLAYRIRCRLLGPPLTKVELKGERLSKRTALGVLSSDCISSSAYGSEEILLVLIPLFGLAAYTLLLPMTGNVLVVLVLEPNPIPCLAHVAADRLAGHVQPRPSGGRVGAVGCGNARQRRPRGALRAPRRASPA